MISKNEIIDILQESNLWGKKQDIGISRQTYIDFFHRTRKMKEAISVLSVRRAGKSTLSKQFLSHWVSLGFDPNQTLYINFEEPLFSQHLSLELIEQIYSAYREIVKKEGPACIVLDEVQNIQEWEKWVRSAIEKYRDLKIVVTGSSSKLLSSEFSTVMSGRSIPLHVFPLSFKEFLYFKDFKVHKFTDRKKIKFMLNEYLQYGGFPQVVLEEKKNKNLLLKEYFEAIVLRDIASRYGVRETGILRALATYLLINIASPVSIGKLTKVIQESFKQKTSLETISRFLQYMESAYLIYLIPIFSYKIKDQMHYPRKIYSIDSGIRNSISFRFSEDIGKIYENIVLLDLKRKGKEIYYWKGKKGHEVDFIVKEGIDVKEIIQVCFNITDKKTREREVSTILEAMDHFNKKEAVVINEEVEKEEVIREKKIKFIPLWKWLLP